MEFSFDQLINGNDRENINHVELQTPVGLGGGGGNRRIPYRQNNNNNNNNAPERRRGRRRRREVPSIDEIIAEAAEAEEAGSGNKKEKTYTLIGLPALTEFYDRNGLPKPNSDCVLCSYPSHVAKDHRSIGVESKDMIKIAKIMRSGTVNCNWENVAHQITEKWNEMAERVNKRNNANHPNRKRLKRLDVSTALAHLQEHILAPDLITNKMTLDILKGWNKIWTTCIMEKDKKTGRLSFSEPQVRNAQRLHSMMQSSMKNKPGEMMNYQKDVHTDSSKSGQFVQYEGFRFIQTIKRRKL